MGYQCRLVISWAEPGGYVIARAACRFTQEEALCRVTRGQSDARLEASSLFRVIPAERCVDHGGERKG